MEPSRARELVELDPRNADVLFPYLSGQDLNSRYDFLARRWVINFHDWPEQKAAQYAECFEQIVRLVKPERDVNKKAFYRNRWWQFGERQTSLLKRLETLTEAIAIAQTSKTVMPAIVSTGQVLSFGVAVFCSSDRALFALLSSAPHYWWAIARASTLKGDLRYTPTDVFETFARPALSEELRALGERLDSYRRELMLARQAGLTATYNLVHDVRCTDEDIAELRRVHTAIDEAVARAYGWADLDLNHGFHDTRQGPRYTVGPVAQQEIVDRLLELNHARYAAEQATGAGGGVAVQHQLDLDTTEE